MTAVINFTPLYGSNEDEPFCSILQIDDFRILLDCGWDERFDEKQLEPLKRVIPDINCVLLSHANLSHLGALPYAVGKLGLSCPMYCTKPVWDLGQMFMYDAYSARKKYDFEIFDLEDVDAAFVKNRNMKKLGYQVDETLADRGEGIIITPYHSGHIVGGTMWKITKENEEILYAVDYNHRRERHLEGCLLDVCSQRPTLLISDAMMGSTQQGERKLRQQKDADFNQAWLETLRAGGNVLIPCDAAGRVLELLLLTHMFWQHKRLGKLTYSLVFLSDVSVTTLDFCRNLIAWMSAAIKKQNDDENQSPFLLKDLHRCYSVEELYKLRHPYVCFATSATLETSFSQDLFIKLADDPKNLILFTTQTPSWTLASRILAAHKGARPHGQRVHVTFPRRENIKLEGEEKALFLEERKMKKEQHQLEQQVEMEDDEEDDEEDVTDEGLAMRRTKFLVPKFPMYPCVEVKKFYTVYGETIAPDDYKIVEPSFPEGQTSTVEEVEMEEEDDSPPKKTIIKQLTVEVRCGVRFIDFEGRAAGDSMENMFLRLAPKKLILIHGSEPAKTQLVQNCTEKIRGCKEIITPVNGQCVDVSSGQNILRINLKDSFVQSLTFVKVGDEHEIAFVEGEIKIDYKEASMPILCRPMRVQGHSDVFVGNFTNFVSDLKDTLNGHNIEAEIINHVVVCCHGLVNIQKVGNGNEISIQGALCEEYFKIRSLLYGLYTIV